MKSHLLTVLLLILAACSQGSPIGPLEEEPIRRSVQSSSSTEAFAYVANAGSDNVSVIETSTNTVATTVTVGDGPIGVAITHDGAFAYVTNAGSNNVSVIET